MLLEDQVSSLEALEDLVVLLAFSSEPLEVHRVLVSSFQVVRASWAVQFIRVWPA